TIRAPSRDTSDTPSSRWTAGSVSLPGAPHPAPRHPRDASRRDWRRAGEGTGWFRRRDGSSADLFERGALEVGAAVQEPRQPKASIGTDVERTQHATGIERSRRQHERSEERRVGKERTSWRRSGHLNIKSL